MILVRILQNRHSVVKLCIASAPLSSKGGWYLAMLSMYRFTDLLQAVATTPTLYHYLSFLQYKIGVANPQLLASNPPVHAV